MYHPTEMANAVTPISWFYSLYTHTPLNQTQRDFPSRLEISFFLDSDASISVLTTPPKLLLKNSLIINTLKHLTLQQLLQIRQKFIFYTMLL